MPRPIKKHLVNTRRRKHHGGGKKKVSKKGRTTKRKVGGRSCSSLVNNKQGGAETVRLPLFNYNITIKEIIDNGSTAAEELKAEGIVDGNKIYEVYQKYLVPIKEYNYRRFEKDAVLFWHFIKLEIINFKEKSKSKSLRKFVEDCLYKWSWSNSASTSPEIHAYMPSLKDWENFDLWGVVKLLNGDVPAGDDKTWAPNFVDKATVKQEMETPIWRQYNTDRRTRISLGYDGDYKYHANSKGNTDRNNKNTINFGDDAYAEYRLWIIFKACFEEYHKAQRLSLCRSKRTILKELFGETTFARPPPTEAERRRERAARWRKLGDVLEAEAAHDRKAAAEAKEERRRAQSLQ
tara:strand:- start:3259 stop:4305 length:1047 start_codon:yes stop_codon:yes gene_type:complete